MENKRIIQVDEKVRTARISPLLLLQGGRAYGTVRVEC